MPAATYKWACLSISGVDTGAGINLGCTTNHACHLWQYWSPLSPYTTKKGLERRGVVLCFLKNFALKYHYLIEQTEAGDTTTHTFPNTPWTVCTTRWYFFHGKHAGEWSPSNSPIFHIHRTQPPVTFYFYPNSHPETTSVDGEVIRSVSAPGNTWTTIRQGGGTTSYDNGTTVTLGFACSGLAGLYYYLRRLIFLFNTTIIPPGSEIVDAKLRLFCTGKTNDGNWTRLDAGIFPGNPQSNVALVASDYQRINDTLLSSVILHADMVVNGFNTWTFTESGRSYITPGGITKLSLRFAYYDGAFHDPGWVLNKTGKFFFRTAEFTGLYWDPRLEVTYLPPS